MRGGAENTTNTNNNDNNNDSSNSSSNENNRPYQRYYHLFIQGELEALCAQIRKFNPIVFHLFIYLLLANVTLIESYYDADNWCVVLKKIAK